MSVDERVTRSLARGLSRRSFLKTAGAFVAGLGLALAGTPRPASAELFCCPGPECSGCRNVGSTCPIGYTKQSSFQCCIADYQYTCTVCKQNGTSYTCCCAHDDLVCCQGQPNCANELPSA